MDDDEREPYRSDGWEPDEPEDGGPSRGERAGELAREAGDRMRRSAAAGAGVLSRGLWWIWGCFDLSDARFDADETVRARKQKKPDEFLVAARASWLLTYLVAFVFAVSFLAMCAGRRVEVVVVLGLGVLAVARLSHKGGYRRLVAWSALALTLLIPLLFSLVAVWVWAFVELYETRYARIVRTRDAIAAVGWRFFGSTRENIPVAKANLFSGQRYWWLWFLDVGWVGLDSASSKDQRFHHFGMVRHPEAVADALRTGGFSTDSGEEVS